MRKVCSMLCLDVRKTCKNQILFLVDYYYALSNSIPDVCVCIITDVTGYCGVRGKITIRVQ